MKISRKYILSNILILADSAESQEKLFEERYD